MYSLYFYNKKIKIETHFALSVSVSAINESLILFLAQHTETSNTNLSLISRTGSLIKTWLCLRHLT